MDKLLKKIYFALASLAVFCSINSLVVYAQVDCIYVTDEADILSDEEEEGLESYLTNLSEKIGADVAFISVESTEGERIDTYTDNAYEGMGYGMNSTYDGIMLLVNMDNSNRGYYISTEGACITSVNDAAIEKLKDDIKPLLSDGKYYDAVKTYADDVEFFSDLAMNGSPYGERATGFPWGMAIAGSFIASAIAALVSLLANLSALKSISARDAANDYTRQGSLKITRSTENFLYHTITKRKKPENNSGGKSTTHTSSSGRTHGGGGGSF